MTELDKFEIGDLVFSNEDHDQLGVESDSPGIVVDVVEELDGTQVEVAVEFYPDFNEVRFATHELTIVGREGTLTTVGEIEEKDIMMMVSPAEELVKFRVLDILNLPNGEVNFYGEDADDTFETHSFTLTPDTDIFKVSA